MSYFSEHKRGFIGTILLHGILLILLFVFGFFTPLPLPGEEGIIVNFGNENFGHGRKEPSPKKVSPPPVKKEEKKVEPKRTSPPPPKTIVTSPPKVAKQEILTQDLEKTAAIEAAKKKKEEEEDRKRKEEERKKEIERQKELEKQKELDKKLEEERKERERLEEIERQKQAELARIAKEKEEQRLREEAERKKREEEQQKINEINSRAKNVFGASGKGSTDSESTGQGVTYKGGNQGKPNGAVNSDNYNDGGGLGNGISYSLGGRSALSLPTPYYPGNEEGVVVVQVTVDKYGKVTKAVPGYKGSTTLRADLLAAAKKAALLAASISMKKHLLSSREPLLISLFWIRKFLQLLVNVYNYPTLFVSFR